MGTAPDQI